jgi:hypothetical protein
MVIVPADAAPVSRIISAAPTQPSTLRHGNDDLTNTLSHFETPSILGSNDGNHIRLNIP